jgi:transcriptional regulator with XRE-family HTH domain
MAATRKIFAENLNRLIEKKKHTAKSLAIATGIQYSTVWLWISGKRFPSPDYIDLLCKVLKLHPSELYRKIPRGPKRQTKALKKHGRRAEKIPGWVPPSKTNDLPSHDEE